MDLRSGKRMERVTRILVTGTGGIGGTNFVRALRLAETQEGTKLFLACTDHNPHYLHFPQADARCVSPRHNDPSFVHVLLKLIKKYDIRFLHPHPSSEARVISEHRALFKNAKAETYLPRPTSIMPDKLEMQETLSKNKVPVPKTVAIESFSDIANAFSEIGHPLWIRAKYGAGGRLGLKVDTPEQAQHWVKLNALQKRATLGDFILHEYLPGRDLAFDSLWFEGKLITSYVRERLEYILKHISLSGITGTPAIARTVEDGRLNEVGVEAIRAMDSKPHGFFSVDMKEDATGRPVVTEVDGKWHTTAPLWGYAFAKVFDRPELNIAYQYLMLGLNRSLNIDLPKFDLFPNNHYLIRQLDAGVILECDDNTWRII
jgi:carbamoyl-phosphate synthase large subunit